MFDIADSLRQLDELASRRGLRAALVHLNQLTLHRFSGVYLFDGDTLRNVLGVDRERPEFRHFDDVAASAAYCRFVRDGRCTFGVWDALVDDRLAGHPAQLAVRSYCGVPLVDAGGGARGTLCHFDFGPVPVRPRMVELMEAFAPVAIRAIGDAAPTLVADTAC